MEIIKKTEISEFETLKDCVGKHYTCNSCKSVLKLEDTDWIIKEDCGIKYNGSTFSQALFFYVRCPICNETIMIKGTFVKFDEKGNIFNEQKHTSSL